jgi:hypothetical protein
VRRQRFERLRLPGERCPYAEDRSVWWLLLSLLGLLAALYSAMPW